jgi:NTE family protein
MRHRGAQQGKRIGASPRRIRDLFRTASAWPIFAAMERVPFVLSGGGARGFAHLGVLEACAEMGIVPSAISGTSAGALLGAFIAAGMPPDQVLPLIHAHAPGIFNPWRILRGDRLTQQRMRAYLEAYLPARRFEELTIPFHVAVTDFSTGRQLILSRGELVPALLAACAVPLVFPAVEIDGVTCVDGGLSNNLPIEPFDDRRQEVICVYVNPLVPLNSRLRFRETLDRTVHLSFREMVARSAKGCRLLIEPPDLAAFSAFSLYDADLIRSIGYAHARQVIAEAM